MDSAQSIEESNLDVVLECLRLVTPPGSQKIKVQVAFYRGQKIAKTEPMRFSTSIAEINKKLSVKTSIRKADANYEIKEVDLQVACEVDGLKFNRKHQLKIGDFMDYRPRFLSLKVSEQPQITLECKVEILNVDKLGHQVDSQGVDPKGQNTISNTNDYGKFFQNPSANNLNVPKLGLNYNTIGGSSKSASSRQEESQANIRARSKGVIDIQNESPMISPRSAVSASRIPSSASQVNQLEKKINDLREDLLEARGKLMEKDTRIKELENQCTNLTKQSTMLHKQYELKIRQVQLNVKNAQMRTKQYQNQLIASKAREKEQATIIKGHVDKIKEQSLWLKQLEDKVKSAQQRADRIRIKCKEQIEAVKSAGNLSNGSLGLLGNKTMAGTSTTQQPHSLQQLSQASIESNTQSDAPSKHRSDIPVTDRSSTSSPVAKELQQKHFQLESAYSKLREKNNTLEMTVKMLEGKLKYATTIENPILPCQRCEQFETLLAKKEEQAKQRNVSLVSECKKAINSLKVKLQESQAKLSQLPAKDQQIDALTKQIIYLQKQIKVLKGEICSSKELIPQPSPQVALQVRMDLERFRRQNDGLKKTETTLLKKNHELLEQVKQMESDLLSSKQNLSKILAALHLHGDERIVSMIEAQLG